LRPGSRLHAAHTHRGGAECPDRPSLIAGEVTERAGRALAFPTGDVRIVRVRERRPPRDGDAAHHRPPFTARPRTVQRQLSGTYRGAHRGGGDRPYRFAVGHAAHFYGTAPADCHHDREAVEVFTAGANP